MKHLGAIHLVITLFLVSVLIFSICQFFETPAQPSEAEFVVSFEKVESLNSDTKIIENSDVLVSASEFSVDCSNRCHRIAQAVDVDVTDEQIETRDNITTLGASVEFEEILDAPTTSAAESSSIILMSNQLTEAVDVSSSDIELLACVIYQEAGGDYLEDLTRYMIGDVVLNRVLDSRFPDTLEGVLTQKGQWGRFYYTGVVWPERAAYETETHAVDRAYTIAEDLLNGNHTEIYDTNYIYMAEFEQGYDIIIQDELYFGRG